MAERNPSELAMRTATPLDGEAAPEVPTAKPSGRFGWRGTFQLLGLLGWALAGLVAWLFFQTRPPHPQGAVTQTTLPRPAIASEPENSLGSTTAAIPAADTTAPADWLARIDQFLTDGDLTAALRTLDGTGRTMSTSKSAPLFYRQAIAWEAAGDRDRAVAAYQQALKYASTDRMKIAARLGLARIWFSDGRADLMLSILGTTLLELSDESPLATRMGGDLAHLVALARAQRVRGGGNLNWLDDSQCVTARPRVDTPYLLQLVLGPDADRSQVVSEQQKLEVVYQYGQHPDEIFLRVIQRQVVTRQLVEAIAGMAETRIIWTSAASAAAVGRTVEPRSSNMSMAGVLDNLLEPLDLVWRFEDGAVNISVATELSNEERSEYFQESAARSLHLALTLAPEHPFAANVYLELGNLAFQSGDYQAAADHYGKLVEQYPHAPAIAEAWFNLAKARLNLWDSDAAREAFYRVADGAQGHPLESAAYLYIGRSFLDDGRSDDATRPLRRAVRRATRPDIIAAAAVTLAAAYLMVDNPHAAVTALMDQRATIDGSRFHNVGVFLAALGRARAAPDSARRMQHGRMLVAALSQAKPESFFGNYSYLLMGRAMNSVGLVDEATSLYELALERDIDSAVREAVRLELAHHYLQNGDTRSSLEQFGSIAQDGSPRSARIAMIKLAELSLDAGDTGACRRTCQKLLDNCELDPEKRRLLRLLGRSYERERDYYHAALCFAGLSPGDEVPEDLADMSGTVEQEP